MPAMDFPNTPAIGDTFGSTGTVWRWDGARWISTSGPSGPSGVVSRPGLQSGSPRVLVASVAQPISNSVTFTFKAGRVYRVNLRVRAIGTATPCHVRFGLLINGVIYNDHYSWQSADYGGASVSMLVSYTTDSTYTVQWQATGNTACNLFLDSDQNGFYIEDVTFEAGTSGTPSLAAFPMALVSRSVGQSIPNTTLTAVLWDVEDTDPNGIHDNVSNTSRLTVPAGMGGLWLVSFTTTFASNNIGYRSSWIQTNANTADRYAVSTVPMVGGGEYSQSGTTLLRLVDGDYVQLIVSQTSGAALNLLGNNTATNFCSFSAVRLSA